MLSESRKKTALRKMKIKSNRLATFNNWADFFPNKNVLALTGFFSTRQWDLVRCHFCSVEIGFWEEGDDIVSEHQRYAPSCDLLKRRVTSNVPISQELLDNILPVVDVQPCMCNGSRMQTTKVAFQLLTFL